MALSKLADEHTYKIRAILGIKDPFPPSLSSEVGCSDDCD